MSLSSARFRGNQRLEAITSGNVPKLLTYKRSRRGVRVVQEALIDYGGYNIPNGSTDYFGQQTATAVISFKTNHNLTPNDSVVGIQTITTLDNRFAVPYADRREWLEQFSRPFPYLNFNRFKETLRRFQGGTFTFNPVGVQLPNDMRTAFLTGLQALLHSRTTSWS